MKAVTRYQADDGSVWDSPDKAMERDAEQASVTAIMTGLKPRPSGCKFSNSPDHISHGANAVAIVKGQLIELSRPRMGGWVEKQEAKGTRAIDIDASWFCRFIDHDGPLARAWSRMSQIDMETGREYGQPYYNGAGKKERSGNEWKGGVA